MSNMDSGCPMPPAAPKTHTLVDMSRATDRVVAAVRVDKEANAVIDEESILSNGISLLFQLKVKGTSTK